MHTLKLAGAAALVSATLCLGTGCVRTTRSNTDYAATSSYGAMATVPSNTPSRVPYTPATTNASHTPTIKGGAGTVSGSPNSANDPNR